MARLIPLGETVTRGEQKTLEYLRHYLPEDWVVFGNAMVSTGELTRELDAIVVGDRCLWVVDEKGFGGRITGDGHTWVLSNGSARERVLNSVLHAAKMLKGKLTSADPRLVGVWVEGLVLLSADDVEYRIDDLRAGRHVRRLAGCENYFLRVSIPESRPLSPDERQAIERCLAGQAVIDRQRNRFDRIGPYRLLETLAAGPVVRTYRAERERTREVVEMKLYDLSALPDQRTREGERGRAEREFEALRRLRDIQGILRVAESFQPVEGFGPDLHYFALDLPQGPCLASRLADASWPFPTRLAAARRLCEIVAAVHQAEIVHRNLSPTCVHFSRTDSDFQLTGFEFSRLALSTLHFQAGEFPAGPYTAPEVRDSPHNATRASDVYSLGVILFEVISGRRPFGDESRKPGDPDPVLHVGQDLLASGKRSTLENLLQLMLLLSPKDRVNDLADVLTALDSLAQESAHTRLEQPPIAHHPLPVGAPMGDFTVLGYLGAGGCFHAYRVAQRADDSQEYVAKVARYPELLSLAPREFAALSALDHPNIVRAFDVSVRVDAPYHLLEVYAPGRTAGDVAAEGGVTAKQVAEWGAALAAALAYMESRNPPVYHADVSPRNIVLQQDRPRLVDFGLAHLGDRSLDSGVVGTAPYRPPERDAAGVPWPASGDVYSLGLVLCELLFGELPYRCNGGQWSKREIREELFQPRGQASLELLRALRRAIEPEPALRLPNAAELCRELTAAPELTGEIRPLDLERALNPYLNQVLQVYSRGACNAENRGMDSAFARATYVPTELDLQQLPQILDRRFALVVLAGNPGDGKTAFLQQLALRLGFGGESLPLNHWVIEQEGWSFECVLDGSAADSQRGLSSDQVLDAILEPLEEAGERPDVAETLRRTQLLAINDGRLLDYLDDRAEDGSWVVHHLLRCLGEEAGVPHPQVSLVDLNHRSLATGDAEDAFNAVLTALLEGGWGPNRPSEAPWQACDGCRAATSCPVHFNVATLLDPVLGPRVRQRLATLLMLVHSRGRLHVTMREMRSTLAYLIFGNHGCEEIHAELEAGSEGEDREPESLARVRHVRRQRLYFNRLFASGARGGRLFQELTDFDPARVNNPRFDRSAAAAARAPGSLEQLFLPAAKRALPVELAFDGEGETAGTREVHDTLRRRAFFEGQGEDWGPAGSDDYWPEMLPYRGARVWVEHLRRFREGQRGLPADLCQLLCRAISRTDNVPEEGLQGYLAVRTASSPKTDLVVVRLFPLADFRLVWEQAETRATVLGELPSAMLLQYGDGRDPTLEISADLFELLVRFAKGYRLGSQELEGVAAHLQLFKNRLLAMPATEVCLLHPTLGRYRAKQQLVDGIRQIALEVMA